MAHGNKGKQNAKKEEPKTAVLHIRIKPKIKAIYEQKAQKEGLLLSEWVELHLGCVE